MIGATVRNDPDLERVIAKLKGSASHRWTIDRLERLPTADPARWFEIERCLAELQTLTGWQVEELRSLLFRGGDRVGHERFGKLRLVVSGREGTEP